MSYRYKMTNWLALWLLIIGTTARGDEKARMLSGALQDGAPNVAATLGQDGGWLVESKERWDGLRKQISDLGVKVDDHLGAVDFAKENLACAFHFGDRGDQFLLQKIGGNEKTREVEIAMSCVAYKDSPPPSSRMWKLLAVPVAKADATRMSVFTFYPINGKVKPAIDQATLEWEWTFSKKTGEAIGGLTATIEPRAATTKPGEDIQLKFTLSLADAAKQAGQQFAPMRQAVDVWDGKYSNGYRNYGFIVQKPDGAVLEIKPIEIANWDKNAPHPVEIRADKPYVLPGWAEADELKSLKSLGLDTSAAGIYLITGVYQERGDSGDKVPDMWGGIVRSNSIRVEVAK